MILYQENKAIVLRKRSVREFGLAGLCAFVPICCLLAGCTTERWQLSTTPRTPDFQIRKPIELFATAEQSRFGSNEVIYVEPGANLVDYAYDRERQELEVSVEVNRDQTVTLAGPRAGQGQCIRLTNYKWLSRGIRLNDVTGSTKIGSTISFPRDQAASQEHAVTVLLGLIVDRSNEHAGQHNATQSELTATLQSLVIYAPERNLILAQWTRQAEPKTSRPVEVAPVADER